MSIVKHEFTKIIIKIIDNYFPNQGNSILNASELLQYLNIKTRAANEVLNPEQDWLIIMPFMF
jgi:hypothetical protein